MSERSCPIYVLYVGTGKEEVTARLIRKIVAEDAYQEVFAPRFKKRIKRAGVWHLVDAAFVPGYLFVATDDAERLWRELHSVPALTKVLKAAVEGGAGFVPLGPEETTWLERLTKPFERTVDFSEGYAIGNRVVVTSGPLKGYENEIIRFDRHKRYGFIRFEIAGRVKELKVGLEIVSRLPEAKEPSGAEPE